MCYRPRMQRGAPAAGPNAVLGSSCVPGPSPSPWFFPGRVTWCHVSAWRRATRVCVCMCVHAMCVHMHVCTCMCVCVHMCTHTHACVHPRARVRAAAGTGRGRAGGGRGGQGGAAPSSPRLLRGFVLQGGPGGAGSGFALPFCFQPFRLYICMVFIFF